MWLQRPSWNRWVRWIERLQTKDRHCLVAWFAVCWLWIKHEWLRMWPCHLPMQERLRTQRGTLHQTQTTGYLTSILLPAGVCVTLTNFSMFQVRQFVPTFCPGVKYHTNPCTIKTSRNIKHVEVRELGVAVCFEVSQWVWGTQQKSGFQLMFPITTYLHYNHQQF